MGVQNRYKRPPAVVPAGVFRTFGLMTGTADGLLVRLFRAAGLLRRVVNFFRFAATEVAAALGDRGGFLFFFLRSKATIA